MTAVVDTQRLAITILTDENFQNWSLSSESTFAFALASRLRLRSYGSLIYIYPLTIPAACGYSQHTLEYVEFRFHIVGEQLNLMRHFEICLFDYTTHCVAT
jgi:hypothetical protein